MEFFLRHHFKRILSAAIKRKAPKIIAASITSVLNKMFNNPEGEMFCHIDTPQRERAAMVMPAMMPAVFLRIFKSEKIKIWPIS